MKLFEKINSADLEGMSRQEFDALPFGAILLDRQGVVQRYNEWEARLAQRDPGRVIGRNVFTDIAPCTDVAAFRGRLEELVESGQKSYFFDYTFRFPWGERRVRVRFLIESPDMRWVFVTSIV
jgi:photoactive yellow protein